MHTLEGVVLDMIAFERNRTGKQLGHIGQYTCQPVSFGFFKQQPVSTLMYHHKQGVVGKSTYNIRSNKNHPPRHICQQPGSRYLQGHQPDDSKNCHRVFTNQMPDFGMFFEDIFCPDAVWFRAIGKNKIVFFFHNAERY